MNKEPCLMHQFDEPDQVISPFKVVLEKRWFMPIPEHISLYNIQSSIFSLLYKPRPHLKSASWVVNRTRD
nr:hypothetical protein Iba_chr02bCG20720 [Ipomoea batatas]